MTRRFWVAKALLVPGLLLIALGLSFLPSFHTGGYGKQAIDPADYGDIKTYDGAFTVALGPIMDPSHHFELGLGQPIGNPTGILVSEDGKKYIPLPHAEPMGNCGAHVWGYAVNAIVAVGKCVPSWAAVSYDPAGTHARMWIRIDNTSTKARTILFKYDPLP